MVLRVKSRDYHQHQHHRTREYRGGGGGGGGGSGGVVLVHEATVVAVCVLGCGYDMVVRVQLPMTEKNSTEWKKYHRSIMYTINTVSYTHLTLPTNREV